MAPQEPLKNLPVGIQTFADVISGDFLYVDKTHYLHQLISPAKGVYFLSRPRRFGKSTTLTTLESIFQGKKELFKGLFISTTDYAWPIHPVIRLDMKYAAHPTFERAEMGLRNQLRTIAKNQGIELTLELIDDALTELIEKLHQKTHQKVVVLIDEYDKPLIDLLDDIPEAKKIQGLLKRFYGVLKSADEHIRFVLITGVSKFTKVSVFSDLNHLTDLTMDVRYAGLCGYTQEELEFYFSAWIEKLAETEYKTKEETLEKIKTWYNGYRLTKSAIKVYNPWSTMLLFDKQSFENHWFETGTPTFLVQAMKKEAFDLAILDHTISVSNFSTYDIEHLQILPLLFQTGYLTIKGYDEEMDTYELDFPNLEVARAFSVQLVGTFCELGETEDTGFRLGLMAALKADNLTEFFSILNHLFAKIPAHLHDKKEAYYHSIFIAACTMAGIPIEAEKFTSMGRSDAVLQSPTSIYVVELKMNQPADVALKQIADKRYTECYQHLNKTVIAVGVSFNYQERRIVEWRTN